MNTICTFLSLLLLTGLPVKDSARWLVEKTSSLAISGRTNISSFTCGIPGYTEPDTITFTQSGQAIALHGTMRLPVTGFDCHNKLMTADLRKTLRADRYPELVIRLIDLERLPGAQSGTQNIKSGEQNIEGCVEITLAGISRKFEIDYKIQQSTTGSVTLTGARSICFTDFNLKPPTRMAGLVKVNDALNILFTLNLKKL
ncbi:MAG TPA: YceI family protein [Puia sp.]|nr:YceI family protein [Puia sp.]